MTITISEEELITIKGRMQSHFLKGITQLKEDVDPLIERHLKGKFDKELASAISRFANHCQQMPVVVSL